jgi:hypothetical protein
VPSDRREALDLGRGTVVVEAGACDGKLVPEKTAAGRRQVRLSGEAVRLLREQLLARTPNELGLVFPTPNGAVWRKDNFMSASSGRQSGARGSRRCASTISGTRTPR